MIEDSKNTLEAGGFFQQVEEVTRSWPGQLDSLIDHIWTNEPMRILEISNTVRSVADHNVISARIRIKGSDSKRLDVRKRSYKNFDPVLYRLKLEEENWNDIYEIDNVNIANDFVESRIVKILDEMCPYRTIQFRNDCKSWLTADTKLRMKTRDEMREIARTTKNADSWKSYRTLRNEVNRQVNVDRKKHNNDIYTRHHLNNDVGATYRAAKNQVGWVKNTSPVSFVHEGVKITDPKKMADLQMATFTEKTAKLIRELQPPTIDPCSSLLKSLDKWETKNSRELFNFNTVSELDTLKIIKDISNTTSSANDRIDAISIKHGASILHGPITHVINTSINTSKFANKWKIGKLLPLHKGKGLNPLDPRSYRPISMLPVIGKIVERALQPQLLEFMETSGQINPNHHSYRKDHSTVTAMLELSDAIFNGCEEKKITTLITLDQSAAFDVLSHKILLRKLKLYNVGQESLNWIRSYLSFRSHYVSIGTRQSEYNNVTSGVPQGSVLGPIMYVIYVNELPDVINDDECDERVHGGDENDGRLFSNNCSRCGQLPTYADDSTIIITTKNRFEAQERMNILLDRVKIFLDANSLSLNTGKTEIVECMVRQKRVHQTGAPPQLAITLPDGTLKVIGAKESCRLLGGNVNQDVNWNHHLEQGEKPLLKSLRSILGILSHLSKNLPQKSRLLLANGLFLSRLLYLLPMWGGLPAKEAKRVQILMNKCARVVLKKGRRTRTRTLMTECHWLYFRELVYFHSLVQTFKILKSNKPVNLRRKFDVTNEGKINFKQG